MPVYLELFHGRTSITEQIGRLGSRRTHLGAYQTFLNGAMSDGSLNGFSASP